MPKQTRTKLIDVSQLKASASGHFFRTTANLDNAAVEKLFRTIMKEWAQGRPLVRDVRESRTANGKSYQYSFLCIKMKPTEPPFLPGSGLDENRYGFVLLIEIDRLLGFFKRGPTGFEDWIDSTCALIGTRELTRVFSANAIYGKVSLRRMTISQHELRACSYEAADLATTIPALGLGRSIPRFIRLTRPVANHPPETVSITPATSRVAKSGRKLGVDGLANVVSDIARQISAAPGQGFLDVFPVTIDLNALPQGVQPTGILFDLSALNASSAGGGCQILLRRTGRSDTDVTNSIRSRFSEVLPLTPQTTQMVFGKSKRTVRGDLIRNPRSYSVKFHSRLDLVVQDDDGNQTPFASWIRQQLAFSVCFSSPEFFYTHGQLYQRAGFDKDIALVESVLNAKPELATRTSEKGRTKAYTKKTKVFDTDSIFAFVEDSLCKTSRHLWCCDLGDEWADYVAIDPRKGGGQLQFFHCKHGDETCGASAFQEVVGQATKNLGRVQITPRRLLEKIADLRRNPQWGKTAIPRYRGPGNLEADAEGVVGSPDTRRTVALVVTMLSRKAFRDEARKTTKEPHFIQLVWLLTAFINSCREMGSRAIIVCKP